MESIKRIKGTDDILPPEIYLWQFMETKIREIMQRYNYQEMRIPIFEHTELFARSIGEATDIVSKEMYTFNDLGGRSLTLRPEGTAGVVRAYIEHSLGAKEPVVKCYYICPIFRQEKPQKGRRRQFNQFGIEVLGTDSAYADVEGILLNLGILKGLGIDDCQLRINSIGDPDCRVRYRVALKEYLKPRLDELCEDCRIRFEKNPLRILDCKRESCQAELKEAPVVLDHLGEESKEHFEQVRSGLDKLNTDYSIDKRLVRGLDYYTRTVFEIISQSLGAQDSLSGGGRYDLLVEQLGGKPTPAFGFAAGMERLILVMQESERLEMPVRSIDCFIAAPKGENLDEALILAEKVRDRNLSAEIDLLSRSLKAELKTANKLNANFVVILGDNELKRGVGSVRDMKSSEQWEEPLDKLPTRLAELVSTRRGKREGF